MTPEEQKNFVHELLLTLERRTAEAIDKGEVPVTWEGKELRALLHVLQEREDRYLTRSERAKFNNVVSTSNI